MRLLATGGVETERSAGTRGKGAIFWEGIASPVEMETWLMSKAETGGNLGLETGLRVTGIENAAAGEMGGVTAEERGAMPGGGMTRSGEERGLGKVAGIPGTVTGAGTAEGAV